MFSEENTKDVVFAVGQGLAWTDGPVEAWVGFILVSSSWPGFPMVLVRKDGSFEEVTHPRYLKPLSERQELLSRGVVLFPGEDIF